MPSNALKRWRPPLVFDARQVAVDPALRARVKALKWAPCPSCRKAPSWRIGDRWCIECVEWRPIRHPRGV